jgi:hypothetical protein
MDTAATVQFASEAAAGGGGGAPSPRAGEDESDERGAFSPAARSSSGRWWGFSRAPSNAGLGHPTIVPPTPGGARAPSAPPAPAPAPAPHSVRALHAAQGRLEAAVFEGAATAGAKGLRKALSGLTEAGVVDGGGASIAAFLTLCGGDVAADAEVGDYLGDEGKGAEAAAVAREVRAAYFAPFSFAGLPFDAALRLFLTRGGFRLPGEAQKIDRITQAFAAAYTRENGGGGGGGGEGAAPPPSRATNEGVLRPSTPDVVEILAFSAIMLNTDAHNASIKRALAARPTRGGPRGPARAPSHPTTRTHTHVRALPTRPSRGEENDSRAVCEQQPRHRRRAPRPAPRLP